MEAPCGTQILSAFEGTANNLIEDNVADTNSRPWSLELYGDDGSIVRHSTSSTGRSATSTSVAAGSTSPVDVRSGRRSEPRSRHADLRQHRDPSGDPRLHRREDDHTDADDRPVGGPPASRRSSSAAHPTSYAGYRRRRDHPARARPRTASTWESARRRSPQPVSVVPTRGNWRIGRTTTAAVPSGAGVRGRRHRGVEPPKRLGTAHRGCLRPRLWHDRRPVGDEPHVGREPPRRRRVQSTASHLSTSDGPQPAPSILHYGARDADPLHRSSRPPRLKFVQDSASSR